MLPGGDLAGWQQTWPPTWPRSDSRLASRHQVKSRTRSSQQHQSTNNRLAARAGKARRTSKVCRIRLLCEGLGSESRSTPTHHMDTPARGSIMCFCGTVCCRKMSEEEMPRIRTKCVLNLDLEGNCEDHVSARMMLRFSRYTPIGKIWVLHL